MKLFGTDFLCTALLLITSADAFSFDLSKRARARDLEFDKSCDIKYGSLTAKKLIQKSMDLQPKLATAGKDGLDNLIAVLEYESKVPGAKKPSASKSELDKIIATYRVLFGDIRANNDDGTPNPTFKKEAADHIAAIKVTRDSLKRMSKPGKPNLIIHCHDDWLKETGPKAAGPKPTAPLKPGFKYFFDMDRNRWISVKGGNPCHGDRAAFTTMNKKLPGTPREKGRERVTFCRNFLEQQDQLEKDKQPHLWDISTTKLPDTFTTYDEKGKKDETLPFHISTFETKIGAKWFHEFMHTALFHPDSKKFSDKKVPESQGGTKGLAYGFKGAVGLAKEKGGKNIAESSRNIENILYWSLAMYYDKWVWSTGYPKDSSSLDAPPEEAASIDGEEEFQVQAAKKGGSKKPPKTEKPAEPPKTEKPVEPPKTEAPPPKTEAPPPPPKTEAPPPPPKTEAPPPPKTEAPVEPPKTDKPVDPPKTSAAPPPPSSQAPPPPPPTSAAAPPVASSQAAPPLSSKVPPIVSTQVSGSKSASAPPISTPVSGVPTTVSGSNTASITSRPHSSCSNTLCTLASSSATPTSSEAVPQETFEPEPMNAGSMTADEIIAIAGTIAAEQVAVMALWDQALAGMGLPSETVEGDPTASLGTGLPMATGGLGGAGNGTWSMPALRVRKDGARERRMYDYAS